MARLKLSEYQAKQLIYPTLKLKFRGFAANLTTTAKDLRSHFGNTNLVLKVDQGIKKRGKLGLVKLNLTPAEIPPLIKQWSHHGWTHFLIEPVIEHANSAEHYLSLARGRAGWDIFYSDHGGIEVESAWDQVTTQVPPALTHMIHDSLLPTLTKYHLVFVEFNPVLVRGKELIPLDIAAEIDDAALSLPELQGLGLSPVIAKDVSSVERSVAELDAATPASLKFRLINPQGSIWVLLSGGGASLVIADEVADQGLGSALANYGEYSGAPTGDDVYAYTTLVLEALLRSTAKKKVLIIAGGVANFTDVAKTFSGIIRALTTNQAKLKAAKLKVYVRRGGPNEERGLANMHNFLAHSGLLGSVHGHATPLTQVVAEAKKYL